MPYAAQIRTRQEADENRKRNMPRIVELNDMIFALDRELDKNPPREEYATILAKRIRLMSELHGLCRQSDLN